MPFGNSTSDLSRRDILRIARRFNAGKEESPIAEVPQGRLNGLYVIRQNFQPPLRGLPCFGVRPDDESPGYFQTSVKTLIWLSLAWNNLQV
jgi:hypothetical protein